MKKYSLFFCLGIFLLFTGCSKPKDVFNNIKDTFAEKVPEFTSKVGEKTKDFSETAVDKIKDIVNDSSKRIDIKTEFIYSQPELEVLDIQTTDTHIFSFKKDLYVTINMTPDTKLLEATKELLKISEKAVPVDINVKLPKTFSVISTGGTVSEIIKKDNSTRFLLDIYNTKDKVYSIILKISGNTEGEGAIDIKFGDNSNKERDLESDIQQRIKFERR